MPLELEVHLPGDTDAHGVLSRQATLEYRDTIL